MQYGSGIQIMDSNGKTESEVRGKEIILLGGSSVGTSALTVTSEDQSNVQLQKCIIITYRNLLSYANGARVTYVSLSPYNCGSNYVVSINGGYTGKNSVVNSGLDLSQVNYWGTLNGWCAQDSLVNDDSKNNIDLTHDGKAKNNKSSTTVSVSGSSTTVTTMINPRAFHGDINKCMFKMSECYLASANSDGDVGKYKIFVSSCNNESVATNPNDSSWNFVTEGSLTSDKILTKVYNGAVNFKYIKLELNSRGKSYMELAAIKVF